ncbi:MAG: transposase [Clostridiales bacterium]|nr:transposase [Clostridiales bacterium]
MYANFEYTTNLQYKVKSLDARVKAFESGAKYTAMQAAHKAQLVGKDREIKELKVELGDANCRAVNIRKNFQQVIEDMEDEHKKELERKDRKIKALEKDLLETQIMLDAEKDRCRDKVKELYRVETELEEEKGKNQKLTAQINRDYENSSLASSQKLNRKKIVNNREKTGRKPGGQFGHKGHARKRHVPTNRIYIPAPEEYANSPDYKPTGRIITKQKAGIRVCLIVDEYATPEFRHVKTGQRVHAAFPAGVINDVNYDGSVKALAYMLCNCCNVSVVKVSDLIADLTGGGLKISTGMINGLTKEFSRKTEAEQKKAFADMLLSPVMNLDFTTARVSGKSMNVLVCATPLNVLYFAREHKGHEGIKGSPAKDYLNTMIHDHDRTYYRYGRYHQECLEHALRYLKGSMENEPHLTWNKQMRGLVKEMIHFRNGLDPDDGRDPNEAYPKEVEKFEERYDEILKLAKEEYEYEPPSKYYMDGFNQFKKMRDFRDNHLLFLHDIRVPPTNNLSERLLRVFKRKLAQAMTFRSFEGLDYLCKSLGTIASLRGQGQNLYESITRIFDRVAGA